MPTRSLPDHADLKPARIATLLCSLALLASSASATQLPREVAVFLDLRASCDHWRGEHGYDEERQKDIDWSICQSCSGTDAELARLKRKYARNTAVSEALRGLEPRVEPVDKAAAARFCRATREPSWHK